MINESIFPYAYVLNDRYQEAREAQRAIDCAKILKKMEDNAGLGFVYVPLLKQDIAEELRDLGYDITTISATITGKMHESKIDWRQASLALELNLE